MTTLANPAATYCVSVGGTYNVVAGTCTVGGVAYDAWALYYSAMGVTPSETGDVMTEMISGFIMPMMMLVMMMSMMTPMVKSMSK